MREHYYALSSRYVIRRAQGIPIRAFSQSNLTEVVFFELLSALAENGYRIDKKYSYPLYDEPNGPN